MTRRYLGKGRKSIKIEVIPRQCENDPPYMVMIEGVRVDDDEHHLLRVLGMVSEFDKYVDPDDKPLADSYMEWYVRTRIRPEQKPTILGMPVQANPYVDEAYLIEKPAEPAGKPQHVEIKNTEE